MKKIICTFVTLCIIMSSCFIGYCADEIHVPEIFTTDIIYLKQAEYDALKQNFTTIDLSGVATSGYVDEVKDDNKGGWTDEGSGNDMRHFTFTGLNYFKGIPFELVDPAKNDGKAAVILAGRGKSFVPYTVDIPINKKAAGVYFLQCSAWNYGTGDKKGQYTLIYDDGSMAYVELYENENIHNFWGAADYATYQNVWKANHPTGGQENAIGLFALSNPYPEKTIKAIRAESTEAGSRSWLMIMGITLTDSGPYLPDMGIVDLKNPSTSSWISHDGGHSIAEGSALDASNLTEKPAGKHGPLSSHKDNFVFEDGTKIKFWGVNLPFTDTLIDKAKVDEIVGDISRLGYNIVRLTDLDIYNMTDTTTDTVHYVISKLKEKGIYTYLTLNNDEDINRIFVADKRNEQKQAVVSLLDAQNKYTGLSLARDSAVAMIEFMPDSGMYYHTPDVSSTVDDDTLAQLFNKWLKEKYKNNTALKKAWNDGTGVGLNDYESLDNGTVILNKYWKNNALFSEGKAYDIRLFFERLQLDYYNELKAAVETIGYKGLATCNTNPMGDSTLADAYVNSKTDFIARNNINYYTKNGDNLTGANTYYEFDTSLHSVDLGIIGELSKYKYADTPYVITEWNSAPVSQNYAEDFVTMATFGAKQNWNPITYSYMTTGYNDESFITGLYDIYNNPVSRAAQVSAVRLFNAIEKNSQTKTLSVKEREIYLDDHKPYYMVVLGGAVKDMLTKDNFDNFYRYSVAFAGAKSNSKKDVPVQGEYTDSQIKVNTDTGDLYVVTDTAEAYAGEMETGEEIVLKSLDMTLDNAWATAILTSVNGKKLAEDSSLLLTLTASVRNKGFSFVNNTINNAGKSPIIIQPVQGTIELKLEGDFEVYSLKGDGSRGQKLESYKNTEGNTVFYVNSFSYVQDTRSVNFEIVRK